MYLDLDAPSGIFFRPVLERIGSMVSRECRGSGMAHHDSELLGVNGLNSDQDEQPGKQCNYSHRSFLL